VAVGIVGPFTDDASPEDFLSDACALAEETATERGLRIVGTPWKAWIDRSCPEGPLVARFTWVAGEV